MADRGSPVTITVAGQARAAHYQRAREFYDFCDAYGLIVWAEIPYITKRMLNGRQNALSCCAMCSRIIFI